MLVLPLAPGAPARAEACARLSSSCLLSPVFCLSPLIPISRGVSRAVRRENIRTPEDLAGAATQDAVSCANRSSTITGDGSNETSDSPQARGASARFEKKASACQGEGQRKQTKMMLTAEQAVEIYKHREIGPSGVGASARSASSAKSRSIQVAVQYGVNPKTIRDIWNRATWVKATRPSWTDAEGQVAAEYASTQASNSVSGSNGARRETEGSHSARSCCDEVGGRAACCLGCQT